MRKLKKSRNAVSYILTYIVFYLREIELCRIHLTSLPRRDVTWRRRAKDVLYFLRFCA